MNVESVKSWGEASDLSSNSALLSFSLDELDDSRDTGATIRVKHADSVMGFSVRNHIL